METQTQTASEQIFELWVTTTRRKPDHQRLSAHRRQMIADRLEAGFTVEELCEAVRGLPLSDWHQGRNYAGRPLDDLDDVLRSDKAVRKLRDLYLASRPRVPVELVFCDACDRGWIWVGDDTVARCSCQS